ncbi:MAG: hypothetical protein GF364_07975 [Candidatus Lokiarchaeota archaeon]|nr:hypothetical protein [Candidatus Lokiarchaeota archaeon]
MCKLSRVLSVRDGTADIEGWVPGSSKIFRGDKEKMENFLDPWKKYKK